MARETTPRARTHATSAARVVVGLVALATLLATPLGAFLPPLPADQGASGLGLALRRLGVTARVLCVTAHPDDEHNGILVRLSRGLGIRTTLFTLTRGEGGQNLIGAERDEALGVLRTGELEAVHRWDGAAQAFGRAYDFGYSMSVDETLARWGREETLGDVVRAIRVFRPDVILTLPMESRAGGQHHAAAAQLAREAFRAAAEPSRFPAQVGAGLRPWQARKLYQGGTGGFPEKLPGRPLVVRTGIYDPLLGLSWQAWGSLARSQHRCQGVGQLVSSPNEGEGIFSLVDAEPPVSDPEADLLDGVDASLAGLLRLADGEARRAVLASDLDGLQRAMDTARAGFDPEAPARLVPRLAAALTLVRRVRDRAASGTFGETGRPEIVARLDDQEEVLLRALPLAQGLVLDAVASDDEATPGETFAVTVSVYNQGASPVTVEDAVLDVPQGWTVHRTAGELRIVEPGGTLRLTHDVTVDADARPSGLPWHRRGSADRHDLDDPAHDGLPFPPPLVKARLRYALAGVTGTLEVPAVFKREGAVVGGERWILPSVAPPVSVRLEPGLLVAPVIAGRGAPKEVEVTVRQAAKNPQSTIVRLTTPEGWRTEPEEAAVSLRREGDQQTVRFTLTPPSRLAEGRAEVGALALRTGRSFGEEVVVVDHDHVAARRFVRPAVAHILAVAVRKAPRTAVGYVLGSGDTVPEALQELGVPVSLLGPDELASQDLSRYSTIVTGIRAYETRADLRAFHGRIMAFVEGGGHLVVQYNRASFNRPDAGSGREGPPGEGSPFAPYPALVTGDRVTDETAPMRVLVPGHPLLRSPNAIGEADWSGWVQERGLQLLDAKDPRYVELLASADPFPLNPGEKKGLLVEARVGKGTWTYVGLALFRQLPAGTPGAYRLLANLVSRPRNR